MKDLLHRSIPFSASGADLLNIFKDKPYVFLLESSLRHRALGRYSFLGFEPFEVVAGNGLEVIERLRKKFAKYFSPEKNPPTPLPGGIVGYLGYDLGLELEKISARRKDDLPVPGLLFGFYDTILTIDHFAKKLHVTSSDKSRRIDDVLGAVTDGLTKTQDALYISPAIVKGNLKLKSNLSSDQYRKTVQTALSYIREGDIYQVNLAQRFSTGALPHGRGVHPFELYRSLRRRSPSSFSSYLDAKDFQIISSSPERFLSKQGRLLQTRPMKGTRPRGKNILQDKKERRNLLLSAKDKAELLMITDLERNDLGRVCEYGSVKVKNMRTIEAYRSVFQATSTVEGIVRKGMDAFDVLQACFPGGSITGCPKIRSMQIIEELEPHHRGIYTGALGYISFNGDMDFNILIRTLLKIKNEIYFHVGGGIVSDSTPEKEYEETLVKAQAMKECLEDVFKAKVTL